MAWLAGRAHAWGRGSSSGSRIQSPEGTSGGSRREAAARRAGRAALLGEPGRHPAPRLSEPRALSPGKDEASPRKPGQVSRGQPCPFRWAYPHLGMAGAQASPGLQPFIHPIRPIHGKIVSVLGAKRLGWGCGPQPAQPPSSGWEPPVSPAPVLNCGDEERERRGARRSPAASSFTLKNKTNPNLDPQHPGPCLHPPRCSPRECCLCNCHD